MQSTCRIVHVLYSGLGGHGNVFFSFVQASKDEGLDYEALFYGIDDVREEYVSRCRTAGIPWLFVKKKRRLDPLYYFRITRALAKSRAQIIFLHSGTHLIPACLANLFSPRKKKIIVRETQANHLKTKAEWLYLKLSLRYADEVVFLTQAYRQEVAARLPALMARAKNKISVIPNGLDTQRFAPAEASQQKLVFAMQSRLVAIKDYPTLLRAFAIYCKQTDVPKAVLTIAGDGPEKENLQALARQLGLADAVHFRGMLNEEDLVAFMQEAQVYVHATLGETMSTSIMQAMACGLPIIASDVKGVQNMIEDGVDGLLVPAQQAEALAGKMILLATDKPLTKRLAQAARDKAERDFSNHRMTQQYRRLFFEKEGEPNA